MRIKGKVKKNKKLINLARKQLDADGTHGSGPGDPTQKTSALRKTLHGRLYGQGDDDGT
jgi:hypothetical protein